MKYRFPASPKLSSGSQDKDKVKDNKIPYFIGKKRENQAENLSSSNTGSELSIDVFQSPLLTKEEIGNGPENPFETDQESFQEQDYTDPTFALPELPPIEEKHLENLDSSSDLSESQKSSPKNSPMKKLSRFAPKSNNS